MFALLSTLSIRHALLSAQRSMRDARTFLEADDAPGAQRAFATAGDQFRSIDGGASGFFLKSVASVPGAGHSATTTLAIADAGATAADAGGLLAQAVIDTPGGLTALSPTGGGFPIAQLAPLTLAVGRADTLLTEALASVLRSPDSMLVGPVGSARSVVISELARLQTTVHSGSLLLRGLPTFLGDGATRRYFLAAQDPAELRGTGGVIGAYTILTIENGRLSFAPFLPIQSLPIPHLSQVPPPSDEYAKNYNQFRGGERFWLAINLTPDFPTAAQAILNAYEVAEGVSLDGVIFADPFALKALLRIEGPTVIPQLGKRVTSENVVPLVTNEAFSLYPNPSVRKEVLGAVATEVVKGFIGGSGVSLDDLKIIGNTVGEGHLLVYSSDPVMQEGLAGTAAGGALPPPVGDFLSVIENSSGSNKVDYYQDRSVTYSVQLGPGGTGEASTKILLTNHAPTTGQPAYVIGPRPGHSKVGESGQLVNVYCGGGCQLQTASRDGNRVKLWSGHELGHPFNQDFFRTSSGATSDLQIASFLPSAWQQQGPAGAYQLTFVGQTTVRPTTLRIEIAVPQGAHIVSVSPSMHVSGTTAVWSGIPTRQMEFTVTFSS